MYQPHNLMTGMLFSDVFRVRCWLVQRLHKFHFILGNHVKQNPRFTGTRHLLYQIKIGLSGFSPAELTKKAMFMLI